MRIAGEPVGEETHGDGRRRESRAGAGAGARRRGSKREIEKRREGRSGTGAVRF
jgi:hypothetical protein